MAKRTGKKAESQANQRLKSSSDEVFKARREMVESIVVAIVLAFLFRAFEAEAFVIPTGSMAPTLQGRHKDITCPECNFRYQAGASYDAETRDGPVQAVTCPMCFFTEEMDPGKWSHASNTGDRILVNKFAFEPPFGNPQRWDVIVFKYPGNAKQNYIKRLVGLDDETIKIRHGDVFRAENDDTVGPDDFEILRKPPDKLPHMLQTVHDSRYLAKTMQEAGWPLSWQSPSAESGWTSSDHGESYQSRATDNVAWLNYRHFFITFDSWSEVFQGTVPSDPPVVPITDFYAYNAQSRPIPTYNASGFTTIHPDWLGSHWVGDLAVEGRFSVESDQGTLQLLLVESGRQHVCEIDVQTGEAKLSIRDVSSGDSWVSADIVFQDEEGAPVGQPVASTSIQGAGTYQVRYANVDNQILLWVNDKLVDFDRPTTYSPTPNDRPTTSDQDPGDLQPVRIGAQQCDVSVDHLRVMRDIYYVATNSELQPTDYRRGTNAQVKRLLKSPDRWRRDDLFDHRGEVIFRMEPAQFFALGDNSPFSKDSRLWRRNQHFVQRDMLIGKAVMIYWPHPWRVGIPGTDYSMGLIPNITGMGLIH